MCLCVRVCVCVRVWEEGCVCAGEWGGEVGEGKRRSEKGGG